MKWSVNDAAELYNVDAWSQGYFRVNPKGSLELVPPGKPGAIDLRCLVEDLVSRGIEMPVLLRFTDLVQARVEKLVTAFGDAMAEVDYQGAYRGVYPVKVNQQRHVIEDLVRFSAPHHLGLEAGSKPELLIALALMRDEGHGLILCNGYKDDAYLEIALTARQLGRNCIVIVEKPDEVERVLQLSEKLGIEPVLGVRSKLAYKGSGHWQGSSGDRAKFGLSIYEIVELVERLRAAGKLHTLRLLHFHIGSQVSSIRAIKSALKEATRTYTELVRLGAPMGYLDVGGGLGVDYDGSRTNFTSSMNYGEAEYASAVVWAIHEACEEAEVPHPNIVTESGRAMVAHTSALIFDVLDVTRRGLQGPTDATPPEGDEWDMLAEMQRIHDELTDRNVQECYHDAVGCRDETLQRFTLGLVSITERASVERLYWVIARRIIERLESSKYMPEELVSLRKTLADTYYCNFSLFQSAPDSWAIDQLFPVLPIHRLDEEPTRRGVLGDITCDSDGKVSSFISLRDVKDTLELHELKAGEPYYLGMFLVGAYQEILGDLHNLFGDTNAVHVSVADNEDGYVVDDVVDGDTVTEVLSYVQYEREDLVRRVRMSIERAHRAGRLTKSQGGRLLRFFRKSLDGYTYLDASGES